jgi:hypothetical protein
MSTLRCFLSRVDLFLTTLIVAPNAESTIYYSVVDITGGTTTSRNLTNAWLFGYEAELNYEALHFFAGIGYSQARGKDEDTGAPLTAIPADKLVAQLGVRDPGWGLSAGLQGRFVDLQDRVPEGVPETPGYAVYDLYASWLPGSASLLGYGSILVSITSVTIGTGAISRLSMKRAGASKSLLRTSSEQGGDG